MHLLEDGPADAPLTIMLAHGAGAPMDSPAMDQLTRALVRQGLRIVRFEFAYMAARRSGDGRKPPPRADRLLGEYRAAIDQQNSPGPLLIGGKSMGGRVASMLADDCITEGRIAGLVCIGYPFHPPGKPEQLRTKHLETLNTPTLICQGTRDPFGTVDEVKNYQLSPSISIEWFEDGDHDLRPRKKISGLTIADHMERLGSVVRSWCDIHLRNLL